MTLAWYSTNTQRYQDAPLPTRACVAKNFLSTPRRLDIKFTEKQKQVTMTEPLVDVYVDMSETSDIDLDFDRELQRMSAAAIHALEAITDEVDALERRASVSKAKTKPPSLDEHFQSTSATTAEKKQSPLDPSPNARQSSLIQHIDDIQLSDEEGEDEMEDDNMSYDTSLDGSIARELDALRAVTQEIERELQNEDGQTMQKAIESLETSDDPKNRILTSDDKEIIRQALLDEMKKYEPKNAWERFMKRYQLEGLSEQDKMYGLAVLCTIVWLKVFYLLYQVIYGEM